MTLCRVAFAAATIFATLAITAPTVTFPLNSQIPPVARVSRPYSYTFPSSTFSSTLAVTYTLAYRPKWLFLDKDSRTLWGIPSSDNAGSDLVSITFGLTATDASGSITLDATLMLSNIPSPTVAIPLSKQLPSFGLSSQPSTVLFHPSVPFNFVFDRATFSFETKTDQVHYYAISINHTPLPAWISFDEGTMSFSGQTPDYYSLIEPPQTFGIKLIASDVEGFAGASLEFNVEVGVHLWAFNNRALYVNVTSGDFLNFTGLSGNLQLDGKTAQLSDIVSITTNIPSWVVFDNKTLSLSGPIPNGTATYNITVRATDIYADTTTATIYMSVNNFNNTPNTTIPSDAIFTRLVGDLNSTIGSSFAYDLGKYLSNKSDISMTTHFKPWTSWLSFNSQTFILAGQVPSNIQPYRVEVALNASSLSQSLTTSQSFVLLVKRASATGMPIPSTTSAPSSKKNSALSLRQALAIGLGILAIVLLLGLLCACCRRRATRRYTDTPTKSIISSPMEARPSLVHIVRPGRLNPPEPLHLDTTGFAAPELERNLSVKVATIVEPPTSQETRRSREISALLEIPPSPLRESSTSGNKGRPISDIALSKTEPSWRSTEGSVYPTLRSSGTSSSRLTRNYSNYSRKGHTRRSAMVFSANPPRPVMGSVVFSQTTDASILGLQDIDFSSSPLEDFTMSRHTAVLDTPQVYFRKATIPQRTTKRRSKFMSSNGRPLSGLGHGSRASVSSSTGIVEKRRSIGHGQDWQDGRALQRSSRTWLTVNDTDHLEQKRRSNISALTDFSDLRSSEGSVNVDPRIRAVTKSPAASTSRSNSRLSNQRLSNARLSRPLSRRIGSSPFFAGSSSRNNSRRLPKKIRMSYADSPTVPNEATMPSNLLAPSLLTHQPLDNKNLVRDSFGISYGMAREGTRQLRSYVNSQFGRSKSRKSMRSIDSRDSRFESAATSMLSRPQSRAHPSPERPQSRLHPSPGRFSGRDVHDRREDSLRPHSRAPHSPERDNDVDVQGEYEEFMRDGFSEGSWETQRSHPHSDENIVLFDAEETAQMISDAAEARRNIYLYSDNVEMARTPGISASNPQRSSEVRFMLGAQRRPLSVDASGSKRHSRAMAEGDHTAYI